MFTAVSIGSQPKWTPTDTLTAKLTLEKMGDNSDNGAYRNPTGLCGNRSIALQDGYSGGFYGKNQALSAFAVTYAPEEITSYEIGAKMALVDRRLRLNVAAFNSTVEDLQEVTTIPSPADGTSISAPFNVGEVEYQGFELEAVGIITDEIRLSAAAGFLDASYNAFDADISGRTGRVPIDNSYLEPKQAPEWTLGLAANYSADFAGGVIGASVTG